MAADFQHWDEVRSPLRADWETQCASFERPRHLAADSRTHRTCLYPREAHRNLRSIRQCPETGNIQNSFPHRRTNWFSKYLNWGMWIFLSLQFSTFFLGSERGNLVQICLAVYSGFGITYFNHAISVWSGGHFKSQILPWMSENIPLPFPISKGIWEQYRRKINPGQSICVPACSG